MKTLTIEELYTASPESAQFERDLQQSLNPRSWDMLLEWVCDLGLPPGSKIVDVGCGTAYWACRLAERFDAHVLAIDPVPSLVATSIERVESAGLERKVEVRQASIEHIPTESDSNDLVWCRDMLAHVRDLAAGLHECHRILRPGGTMLVFKTFAGELLEPREADRLYRALDMASEDLPEEHERMTTRHAECAFTEASFRIEKKDEIASEWREHEVEQGERTTLDTLLRVARLLRRREYFVRQYGEARYEQALADAQWYPFILLGKLVPVAYLLRKVQD